MIHQQRLVAGRGNLRDKDPVSGVFKRLGNIRVIGVQRMSHLMGQCEDVLQILMMIQQYIRMRSVCAPGISSRPLPFILVYVNPAVLKALPQMRKIFLSKRRKPLKHHLLRLFICDHACGIRHHRHIDIIHMKLVKPHQSLSQGNIAVHQIKMIMNRLYQVRIHGHRDIAAVQRHSHGGRVPSHTRKKCLLPDIRRIDRGKRIDVSRINRVQLLERVLPEHPILTHQIRNEHSACQLPLLSVAACRIREHNIRVIESGIYFGRSLRKLSRLCQHLLKLLCQNMLLPAKHPFYLKPVKLKSLFFPEELFQSFLRNAHNLRSYERNRAVRLNGQKLRPAVHILIERLPGILMRLLSRIDIQSLQPQADIRIHPQAGKQYLCAVRKLPFIFPDRGKGSLKRFILPIPLIIRGKQILHCPGILLIQFLSCRNPLHLFHINFPLSVIVYLSYS